MPRVTPRSLALAVLCVTLSSAWRIHVPWDERHWCDQVQDPQWPFAYRKPPTQVRARGRECGVWLV